MPIRYSSSLQRKTTRVQGTRGVCVLPNGYSHLCVASYSKDSAVTVEVKPITRSLAFACIIERSALEEGATFWEYVLFGVRRMGESYPYLEVLVDPLLCLIETSSREPFM